MPPLPTSKEHTLFLVVPGVGNEEKGTTMADFAKSYAVETHLPVIDGADDLLLSQEADAPMHSPAEELPFTDRTEYTLFSVPLIKADGPKEKVTFAELYWDDLSHIGDSLWGTVNGFFDVLLGMRFLLWPLDKYGDAKFPAFFGRLFFAFLRGFILSMSIFSGLAWAVIKLAYIARTELAISGGTYPMIFEEEHMAMLLAIGSTILALVMFTLIVLNRNPIFRNATSQVLLIIASFYACVFYTTPFSNRINYDSSLDIFATLIAQPIRLLWLFGGMLMLMSLLSAIVGALLNKDRMASHFVCGLLPALSLLFWMAISPLVLVSFYFTTPDGMKEAVRSIILTKSLATAGWFYIAIGVTGVLAGLIWMYRARHIKRQVDNAVKEKVPFSREDPVRIVMNPVLTTFLYSLAILLIPISLTVLSNNDMLRREFEWLVPQNQNFAQIVTSLTPTFNGYVIVLLSILLPVVTYNKDVFQRGLGLVLDIINYFRPVKVHEYGWRSMVQGEHEFKIRNQILRRFERALTYFAGKAKDDAPMDLVIISHSQGTILSLDFLTNERYNNILGQFKNIKLVTMGSPYSHIYEHYFPGILEGSKPFDRRIANEKSNWLNIYRSDDYIGTYIATPRDIGAPSRVGSPRNIEVGLGSHTGYFRDKRVVPEICKFVWEGRQ